MLIKRNLEQKLPCYEGLINQKLTLKKNVRRELTLRRDVKRERRHGEDPDEMDSGQYALALLGPLPMRTGMWVTVPPSVLLIIHWIHW